MINTNPKPRRTKLIISLAAAIVIIAGVAAVLIYGNKTPSKSEVKNESTQPTPMFSFTGANDWRQGPSNETSMALFGKARDDQTSACFTSIQYRTGTIDIAAELKEQQDSMAAMGTPLTQIAATPVTLKTTKGDKEYDYHQYNMATNSTEDIMRGLGLGYVQLDEGYVQIDGHCNTAEELASTVPAIEAYKLNN